MKHEFKGIDPRIYLTENEIECIIFLIHNPDEAELLRTMDSARIEQSLTRMACYDLTQRFLLSSRVDGRAVVDEVCVDTRDFKPFVHALRVLWDAMTPRLRQWYGPLLAVEAKEAV